MATVHGIRCIMVRNFATVFVEAICIIVAPLIDHVTVFVVGFARHDLVSAAAGRDLAPTLHIPDGDLIVIAAGIDGSLTTADVV